MSQTRSKYEIKTSSMDVQWPDHTKIIAQITPYLLAGISINSHPQLLLRSTLYKHGDQMSNTYDALIKHVNNRKNHLVKSNIHPVTKTNIATIATKTLDHSNIKLPPIQHKDKSLKNKEIMNDLKKIQQNDLPLQESNHELKDPSSDRKFERSYYNRKNEKNIYSKPPGCRRVRNVIRAEDPEFGLNQDWISSWEPIEKYLEAHINDISLNKPKKDNFVRPKYSATPKNSQKIQKLTSESYSHYIIPQRQRLTILDSDYASLLLKNQSASVIKDKSQINLDMLNENNQNLSSKIMDLSKQEKIIQIQLDKNREKEILAEIQSENKRKKKGLEVFRHAQTFVEDTVCQKDEKELRLARTERFLKACEKHVFLEVRFHQTLTFE